MKKHIHSADTFEVLSDKTPFTYLEAFKTFRTNVEFVSSLENHKAIMLVSSLSGEGKTTASINLAIALAQNGKKVVLCDCDLRRPKVQRYLRIKAASQNGVSTVLGGECSVDNAIGYVEDFGIYVMLSGHTPPNPGELLASERAKAMIDELKTKFDYVICDTPPVSVVSDTLAFSKHTDGAVMVVRQNYASRAEIQEAVAKLKNVETKMLGMVLNDYDSRKDINYKYDKYYSYKNYYVKYKY
ncbi:MAG: CpsD/CapB family tyrosine-protein kinase [Clostridia bacterium]|nr:CpsD/CapB family tyrosine-protein kinase [Clostridia bacterium]